MAACRIETATRLLALAACRIRPAACLLALAARRIGAATRLLALAAGRIEPDMRLLALAAGRIRPAVCLLALAACGIGPDSRLFKSAAWPVALAACRFEQGSRLLESNIVGLPLSDTISDTDASTGLHSQRHKYGTNNTGQVNSWCCWRSMRSGFGNRSSYWRDRTACCPKRIFAISLTGVKPLPFFEPLILDEIRGFSALRMPMPLSAKAKRTSPSFRFT
ncbi:MAG: hypothetical protein JWL59_4887 [Chthoniobacteraceae bacterium]|nr:hypothetical protein [Chthoniobacteraceae bacterium]